jgi:hypothetical protein
VLVIQCKICIKVWYIYMILWRVQGFLIRNRLTVSFQSSMSFICHPVSFPTSRGIRFEFKKPTQYYTIILSYFNLNMLEYLHLIAKPDDQYKEVIPNLDVMYKTSSF